MAESNNLLSGVKVWGQDNIAPVPVAEPKTVDPSSNLLSGIKVWGEKPQQAQVNTSQQTEGKPVGGQLINPEDLAGVTEDNPITNDAEAWASQQPAITGMPQNKVAPEVDIDQQDSSFLDEFMYNFRAGESDVTNAGAFLEAKWPMGKFKISLDGGFEYLSPEELYGKGFMEAPEDVRRVMIRDAKSAEIAKDYPQFADQPPDSALAEFLGGGAKMLMSPTTLFPVGRGVKGLLAIGGIMGAEYEIIDQMRESGQWAPDDLGDVAKAAGIGAGASLVLGTAVNQASKTLGRISAKRRNKQAVEQANKEFDNLYEEVVRIQAVEEVPPQSMPEILSKRTGRSIQEIQETLGTSSKTFVVPTKPQAIAMLEATRSGAVGDSIFLDKLGGILSSRIARYSEPLAQTFQRIEGRIRQASYRDVQIVKPILDAMKKQIPKDKLDIFQEMIFSGSFNEARKFLNDNTQIGRKGLDDLVEFLRQKRQQMVDAGIEIGEVHNHYPRRVTDRNGVREYMGADPVRLSEYKKSLDNYAKAIGKKDRAELTWEEEAVVLNNYHKGKVGVSGKRGKGITGERVFSTVTKEMLPFYDRFDNAMYAYIEDANRLIHTKQLLGSSAKQANGKVAIDVDGSVGLILAREKAAKRIAENDEISEELRQSIQTALSPPKTIGAFTRYMQAITYGETITNVGSAVTQLADLPLTLRANGLYPTIKALLSPRSYRSENVDRILGDMVRTELGTTASTLNFVEKAVDSVLSSTFTMFKRMDKLTKGINMQAAYENAFRLAKTEQGIKRLRDDYGALYGNEFRSLINALKNREQNALTEEFLFIKASEVYPVSRLEQPESILNHPWGRLFTMLKTYTLKSIYDGTVRRGIINNVKKGRIDEAALSALQLVTVFGLAEASVQEVKDFMFGRGFHPSDIVTDNFFDGLLRVAGVSRYVLDRYGSQGDAKQVLLETMAPPFVLLNSAVKDAISKYKGDLNATNSEMLASAPAIGRFYKAFVQVGKDGLSQSERQRRNQDKSRRERELERRLAERDRRMGLN